MYFQLAAKVADAIELLMEAQQKGENGYLKTEQSFVLLAKKSKKTVTD